MPTINSKTCYFYSWAVIVLIVIKAVCLSHICHGNFAADKRHIADGPLWGRMREDSVGFCQTAGVVCLRLSR